METIRWSCNFAVLLQADNIYNDEELDTPAAELEAGTSWAVNRPVLVSLCWTDTSNGLH